MTDLKDILDHEEELNSESLMRYLEGTASAEERYAIEKMMAGSSFIDEAVEGLQQFKDTASAANYVAQLNKQLQQQTRKNDLRKSKRKLKEQHWIVIAILSILMICIAGYLLIHFLRAK
ncbi:MAG: hypothetical protein RLZZ28_1506 [Bacteroidota bacterium]|jgi:ferric-dicitrate binding protein FerR (iron transport regulator)